MSQLLIRLSKISPRNNSLIQKSVRLFSSCPYLTLGGQAKKKLGNGGSIADVLLFDPAKEELVTIPDKTIPKELVNTRQIGSSLAWGLYRGELDSNFLCLIDLYNPVASKLDFMSLPPITTLSFNQTQVVGNVAMSSDSPSSEEEFVIAIKFLGSQLSFFRHGCDHGWTNLEIPFRGLDNSKLIYSQRDERFYMPTPSGNCLLSWDLHFKEPKFCELVFRNHPKLPQSEWELLNSCSRAEHWVESSSGECFLVRWYSYFSPLKQIKPVFMVFREEETIANRYMCYTEDIGDLCIFLSDGQPFCVEASSCPGLKPNSIYIMSPQDFAVYNLATKTFHDFEPPNGASNNGPIVVPIDPYWIPPFFT